MDIYSALTASKEFGKIVGAKRLIQSLQDNIFGVIHVTNLLMEKSFAQLRDPAAQVAYNPETNQTRTISNEGFPAKPVFSNPVTREIKAEFRIKTQLYGGWKKKTSEYQPRVATDICGLNRGTDGAIYGSTIISMHVFVLIQRRETYQIWDA